MPLGNSSTLTENNVFFLINRQNIDRIFTKYFASLAFYGNRFLNDEEKAKDAVHNAFLALWEKRDNAQFKNEGEVKRFLYRVTKYKAIDLVREFIKEQADVGQWSKHFYQATYHPEQKDNAMILAEAVEAVKKAVNELPPQCRAVMELLLQGNTHEEIQMKLNISRGAVRQNKFTAFKRPQEKFKGKEFLFSIIFLLLSIHNQKLE